MHKTRADMSNGQMVLCATLEELAKVWPWVEELSVEFAIPADVSFAISLCLEEALSNIIRHGYQFDCGRPITLGCSVDIYDSARPQLFFVIEDKAPHFNPLDPSLSRQADVAHTLDDLKPGGQGIRLLRKFAGSLHYESLEEGNRLTVGFPLTSAARS